MPCQAGPCRAVRNSLIPHQLSRHDPNGGREEEGGQHYTAHILEVFFVRSHWFENLFGVVPFAIAASSSSVQMSSKILENE
jgi:hypothetical protein